MSKLFINEVAGLRAKGYSYARIAEELGASVNTVQSICRRNNIVGAKVTSGQPLRLCPQCGLPLVTTAGNKSKRFCSDKCRQQWWNNHPEQSGGARLLTQTCQHCGKVFKSFGSRQRKYCSHACYIAARFGGISNDA